MRWDRPFWIGVGVGVGVALCLIFCDEQVLAEAAPGWLELKGKHFIVYYQGDGEQYPNEVLRRAETYYQELAGDLGYSRRDDFWLWENRCSIYLYGAKEAFYASTGQSEWSSGFAIPKQRAIVSYQGADQFLDSVLPHELAHLVFRSFVGVTNQNIPLWLDEGIAMAQEKGKRDDLDRLVRQMIAENKWIPVATLARIRTLEDVSVGHAAVFYAEAQSLVRFLLAYGESDRFIQLCRDLRDGEELGRSLEKNYPKDFPSIDVFERAWKASHD